MPTRWLGRPRAGHRVADVDGTAGEVVDVTTSDGRRLHVERFGHGVPTVVLEAGLGVSRNMWGAVLPHIAERTSVVLYDRSGLGLSPPDPAGRDLPRLVADLLDVLDTLGDGPFVLVGHGWGAPIVRTAADTAAARVAGMVLVDPMDERCALFFGAANRRQVRWSARLLPVLAALGALRRVARKLAADLPEPWAGQMRAEDGTVTAARAQRAELLHSIDDLERLRDARPTLPDVPVTVISGARVSPLERGRRPALIDAHRVTASSMRQGRHVEATASGHYVPFTEPALVAAEIVRVVEGTTPTR
jgi:pimeloyl-ACP methyl ester carboxylesterase